MTGFGKAVGEIGTKKITVEIKSLNSKQLDLFTKIPYIYREKEIEIRALLAQQLERGKIDFNIIIENSSKESSSQINGPIIESYRNQILAISESTGIPVPTDWYSILLRLPESLKTEQQEIPEDEITILMKTINTAITNLKAFRKQEGKSLQNIFENKIKNIKELAAQVTPFEQERMINIRTRIKENLESLSLNAEYDKNRFEQEMFYYIEKIDINEEKNRLSNHLKYFIETINEENNAGKKIGFIAQEIGREINTMGSKANHLEIQKLVVRMKDELEQIKEQVLNVL